MAAEQKGTVKLRTWRQMEEKTQEKWERKKVHEVNSKATQDAKYMCTFPYPYMNGRLHMGHTFSLSKCEFMVRYKRTQGVNGLFPFAFHCTGMPIKACADKLKREMETFGNPPQFPSDVDMKEVEAAKVVSDESSILKDKSKGKKSKAVAKQGTATYQWQIMQMLGLSDEEIPQFADAGHWCNYFPDKCMIDMKSFGGCIDWRRAFITTDISPFYDSFVRWQFVHLKQKGRIAFGARYCIYSPRDNQPCMDHDRQSGEGVGTQEYTLIKMKALDVPKPLAGLSDDDKGKIFLVAATMRPETMYGQTNCWVHPDHDYVAYKTLSGDIFVSGQRAGRNLSFQRVVDESFSILGSLKGTDLIGLKVSSPNAPRPVYVLPMMTVRSDKGTGIVTSVPSDSPDDFAALRDLQNKKPMREKFNLTDDMVLPFVPIPIIDIPGLGTLAAPSVVEEMKIVSQNDKDKLTLAKEKVYLKGFYEGVLIVGPYAGQKVEAVKKILSKELIDSNQAVLYMEPEKEVISRSGDECVVALCDQWYLDYGNPEWKKETKNLLDSINPYHDEVKNSLNATIDWLHEYACSRSYGLGSKLPWDETWLIESLSDSTIYMAFYTVSHLLLGSESLTGVDSQVGALGIKPEQMTNQVWDYIFLKDSPVPSDSPIPKEQLDLLKQEFTYWYPLDLRVTGKDLIPNHLTYMLFNHCAMWNKEPDRLPQAVRANGHLLLNNDKMSKSTGNFLTLSEGINKYSSDGVRFALADAGDGVDDANFVEKQADNGLLKLYNFYEWTKEMLESLDTMRDDNKLVMFADLAFDNQMNHLIKLTEVAYEKMLFKEALKTGFFEFTDARDKYREMCGGERNMNRQLVLKFIETQCIILSPICPHSCDFIYGILKGDPELCITDTRWPQVPAPVDSLRKSYEYVISSGHDFRVKLKNYLLAQVKGKKNAVAVKPSHGSVYVALKFPEWQSIILKTLKETYDKNGLLPENKELAGQFGKIPELKKFMKRVMPFVDFRRNLFLQNGPSALSEKTEFDEMAILKENAAYIMSTMDLEGLEVKPATEEVMTFLKEDCCPMEPLIKFSNEPSVSIKFINNQPSTGVFEMNIPVYSGDTVSKVAGRISRESKQIKDQEKIKVYRYENINTRSIPSLHSPLDGLIQVPDLTTLSLEENNSISVTQGDVKIPVGDKMVFTF